MGASPKAKEMGGDPCWRAFGGKMGVTEGYKQEESCSLDLFVPPKGSCVEGLVPAATVLREKLWGSDTHLINGCDGVLRV